MSRVALTALIGCLLLTCLLRRSDGRSEPQIDAYDWTEWHDWADPPEVMP